MDPGGFGGAPGMAGYDPMMPGGFNDPAMMGGYASGWSNARYGLRSDDAWWF